MLIQATLFGTANEYQKGLYIKRIHGSIKEHFYPLKMITVLGCIGTGIVYGWLTGMLVYNGNRHVRNILFLTLANIITCICIFSVAGWLAVLVFPGSVAASLLTFLGWRYLLRRHFNKLT